MPRVLVTGARAPSALHFARLMDAAGWEVVLADSLRFPMGKITGDGFEVLRYPSPRFDGVEFQEFMLQLAEDRSFDLVVPICEEALHLSVLCKAELGARLATASPEAMIAAHSKLEFAEDLRELGLPSPATRLFRPGMTLSQSPVVVKPVWSRFGERVLLSPSPKEANDLPLGTEWIEQERIAGAEVCATGFCVDGKVTAYCSYEPKYRAGQGAGMYFEPRVNRRLEDILRFYACARSWNGFLSFDAIVDEHGEVWPIECNPRGTSGIHLFRDGIEFASAVAGAGQAVATDTPSAVKAGIAVSRLLQLLSPLRSGAGLREDLRRSENALSLEGRRSGLMNALLTSAELFLVSRRERISLLSASTHDLIWEGGHASS